MGVNITYDAPSRTFFLMMGEREVAKLTTDAFVEVFGWQALVKLHKEMMK